MTVPRFLKAALCISFYPLLTRSVPVEPFLGNGTAFYEAITPNISLPITTPMPADLKPSIQVYTSRLRSSTFLAGELFHTYLSILCQLWEIPEVELIQPGHPLRFTSSEFNNVALTFQPVANPPVIMTTVQAAWAVLEILDEGILTVKRDVRDWGTWDWEVGSSERGLYGEVVTDAVGGGQAVVGGGNETQQAQQAGGDGNTGDLWQSLSTPPKIPLSLPASASVFTLADGDPSLSLTNTTLPPPPSLSNGITITYHFPTPDPSFILPYPTIFYHFRTFLLYTLASDSSADIGVRWPRGTRLTPDVARTKVDGYMRVLIQSGPRPTQGQGEGEGGEGGEGEGGGEGADFRGTRMSFKEVADGLRMILAGVVRRAEARQAAGQGAPWIAFTAVMWKDGVAVLDMGIKRALGDEGGGGGGVVSA